MVNEITTSIYLMFVGIDFALIFLAFLGTELKNHIQIIASVLATTLTFILSHSILNGNVVEYVNGIKTPIQSLPIFYFMEGFAVIMVIYTAFLIYSTIAESFEKHSVFGEMEN
jgi:formate hydrogenlyase subunit 3/multisubunit Na+/H+ antiporter MnhD subunit